MFSTFLATFNAIVAEHPGSMIRDDPLVVEFRSLSIFDDLSNKLGFGYPEARFTDEARTELLALIVRELSPVRAILESEVGEELNLERDANCDCYEGRGTFLLRPNGQESLLDRELSRTPDPWTLYVSQDYCPVDELNRFNLFKRKAPDRQAARRLGIAVLLESDYDNHPWRICVFGDDTE
jgi:hypothetical protein